MKLRICESLLCLVSYPLDRWGGFGFTLFIPDLGGGFKDNVSLMFLGSVSTRQTKSDRNRFWKLEEKARGVVRLISAYDDVQRKIDKIFREIFMGTTSFWMLRNREWSVRNHASSGSRLSK